MNFVADIIFRNNIRFKDKQLDFKIKGHPTLNLTEEIDGKIYFLIMTRHKRKGHKYYKVEPTNTNKLKDCSYLDLSYIYSEDARNIIPSGRLGMPEFEKVVKELNELHPEDLLEKIKLRKEVTNSNQNN